MKAWEGPLSWTSWVNWASDSGTLHAAGIGHFSDIAISFLTSPKLASGNFFCSVNSFLWLQSRKFLVYTCFSARGTFFSLQNGPITRLRKSIPFGTLLVLAAHAMPRRPRIFFLSG